jgi:ribosomal protein S18 acetylase RimI-like enzyme
LWYPPGKAKVGCIQQMLLMPTMLRVAGLRGIGRLIHVMDTLDKVHPETRHYYLQFLGVAPQHQHKGIGTALMHPVLERCDREGCGAYLETAKEGNIGYYQRFGFVVTGEIILGTGSPLMWRMWRAARATA